VIDRVARPPDDPTTAATFATAFGGGGPHFRLGAHLARVELQALSAEVMTRLPDQDPAGPSESLPSTFISGPTAMPVRFTLGSRSRS
jgi:cytochrome P450